MRRLGALAAAGVLVVLAGGFALWRASSGPAVPLYTVTLQRLTVVVEAEGVLKAVRSTPISVPREARPPVRLAWTAPDGAAVRAGDPLLRFDASETVRERDDSRFQLARSELQAQKGKASGEATLSNLERDAELARWEADVASRFESKDDEIFSRREILESRIDGELARRRQEHAEGLAESEAERVRLEGRLLALEQEKSRRVLGQAESALASLEVLAPRDGIFVLQRNFRGELPQAGDTLWGAQTIGELPDLSEMEAEIFVLEADAGQLAPGRPVQLTLESSPGEPLTGTLVRLSSLARPRNNGSPVQFFSATVKLDRTLPDLMRPGQRVLARLHLAEIPDALVVPAQAIFTRDEKKVALVEKGGRLEPVPVELGAVAGGRVVVLSGLVAGDEIALLDPDAPPPESTPTSRPAPPPPPPTSRMVIITG
ncbi:MAG TPA: HlyD family efflux transporter periplasmic adaptor subunit [Thermoanaerobaculia bacterium]|nr:HlyD family efflux transporter periplasmic adaptor subunit [Thermoanaerobaculia bacterium]